jgi:hypothetical protein
MFRILISFLLGIALGLVFFYKLFNKDENSSSTGEGKTNNKNQSKKLKFPPEPDLKLEGDKFFNIVKNMNKLK